MPRVAGAAPGFTASRSSSSRSASAPTARCSAWWTPRSSGPSPSPNPTARHAVGALAALPAQPRLAAEFSGLERAAAAFASFAAIAGGSRTLTRQWRRGRTDPRPGGHLAVLRRARDPSDRGRARSARRTPPGADVVVLGERLWRSRFGGDPSIVGRAVTLDGQPYTVAGVVPAAIPDPLRGRHVDAVRAAAQPRTAAASTTCR